jgi:hypothetical protein
VKLTVSVVNAIFFQEKPQYDTGISDDTPCDSVQNQMVVIFF